LLFGYHRGLGWGDRWEKTENRREKVSNRKREGSWSGGGGIEDKEMIVLGD